MTPREPLPPRLPPEGTTNVLFQSFRTGIALRELMRTAVEGTGVTGEEYGVLGVLQLLPRSHPDRVRGRARHPADHRVASRRPLPPGRPGRADAEPGRRALLPPPPDEEGRQDRRDRSGLELQRSSVRWGRCPSSRSPRSGLAGRSRRRRNELLADPVSGYHLNWSISLLIRSYLMRALSHPFPGLVLGIAWARRPPPLQVVAKHPRRHAAARLSKRTGRVTNFVSHTVSVVDPKRNRVLGKPIRLDSEPCGIVAGSLWIL